MMRQCLASSVLSALCTFAVADNGAPKLNEVDALSEQGYSVRAFTPIYSQLLTFSFPKGFVPAFENEKNGQYIQESVLEGESVKRWSQMITITGAKGLAANPNVTPTRFAGGMAGGFKRVCPNSYTATALGEIKFGSQDGFAAVVSCGMAGATGDQRSESVLLIVIKGESDYYTIQWAERGEASNTRIEFHAPKWTERLKRLTPIKLCPRIPGEQAPYPSCTNA